MKLKVGICMKCFYAGLEVELKVQRILAQSYPDYEIEYDVFMDPEVGKAQIDQYDLFFLETDHIQEVSKKPIDYIFCCRELEGVIFVSKVFDQHVLIEDENVDLYFWKPMSLRHLKNIIDEEMESLNSQKKDPLLVIQGSDGIRKIKLNDIMMIEGYYGSIAIHTVKGGMVEIKGKLNSLVKNIKTDDCLIRIHQSYLVNKNYIKEYNYRTVTLEDDKVLNVSGKYQKEVHRILQGETHLKA